MYAQSGNTLIISLLYFVVFLYYEIDVDHHDYRLVFIVLSLVLILLFMKMCYQSSRRVCKNLRHNYL